MLISYEKKLNQVFDKFKLYQIYYLKRIAGDYMKIKVNADDKLTIGEELVLKEFVVLFTNAIKHESVCCLQIFIEALCQE